ncbi:putative tripeptidyl peptidase [Lyophyllum shimeji]|uniref:tripeptidyl-peptidase II n=1 Tax=Lyophyllum shimeji TaxID=47721 RepID=A0A9P3UK80_LYOSH|nr:putative tripeptidyl peptidase [Lyophyllum shimeji]
MRGPSCRGLLCLVALASFTESLAAGQRCPHKLKESVNPPRGWAKHSIPPAEHNIVLRIALPQPNFGVLEKHLYEVSDPYHPRYGAHLSKEEVDGLVAPHQESIDAVDEWLMSYDIKETDFVRSPAKDWVTLTLPVRLVEEMLNTTYHVWKHEGSGDSIVRTTSYSLPENLHEHIDLVQPTTMFGQFKEMKSTIVWSDDTEAPSQSKNVASIHNPATGVPVDASCNKTITIKCLQQLYNAVGFTPTQLSKNTIGITGYLEEFANLQDLQSFYAEQRPDALNSSFEFISVKGGLNNQTLSEAGAEANLDVQFAFGLSHPIAGTFYSTAGRPPFKPDVGTPTNTNEPYADWLDFVLSHPNTPLTVSTSYGDHEQTVPESYARRTCASFAQLGARGVSLMFSSGDGGVGDNDANPATQTCFTNDGRNATRFIPLFPASCPFVTSVGGTQNVPEIAVSRFFSGGGFSDYFPRPWYQDKVVEKYLKALPKGTYEGLFNPAGRGIPDVAAQGDRFRIWLRGVPRSIGGTSASAPTFAGIVALLNDVRLSHGQPPLGFLNPLLYSKAVSGFNDITIGHNSGCGTTGFNCTEGWDPVTGLGTPNFGKLKKLVL